MATFLAMLYVLLGFSVIVSLFGMVNTLVLSVFERTRELGMLRAIGMTRRQARRMIRHESVITALIGAAMGLPLGVFLAGADHPGDVASTASRSSMPVADARRVHAGGDPRRHRRGDHARAPGLAAQRARRPALRVAMTATITAPPRRGSAARRRAAARLARLERPLLLAGLALVTLHLLDLAFSGPDTAVLGVLGIVAVPAAWALAQPHVTRPTRLALGVVIGLLDARLRRRLARPARRQLRPRLDRRHRRRHDRRRPAARRRPA